MKNTCMLMAIFVVVLLGSISSFASGDCFHINAYLNVVNAGGSHAKFRMTRPDPNNGPPLEVLYFVPNPYNGYADLHPDHAGHWDIDAVWDADPGTPANTNGFWFMVASGVRFINTVGDDDPCNLNPYTYSPFPLGVYWDPSEPYCSGQTITGHIANSRGQFLTVQVSVTSADGIVIDPNVATLYVNQFGYYTYVIQSNSGYGCGYYQFYTPSNGNGVVADAVQYANVLQSTAPGVTLSEQAFYHY